MRHASLFSGIGGFDLAAQWMGWKNVFQVEKDEFCQKVLSKNFPNTKRYEDIKEFDGTKYRGSIDIITGGFPCQPFSVAGKRKGKQDDRYLWPEMLRVIGEVRPAFIVGENVTGIIGMALEQVLTDLENKGYHTETYIIPACSKNAPHRRDRIWIIAHCDSFRFNRIESNAEGYERDGRRQTLCKLKSFSFESVNAYANSEGLSNRIQTGFESVCRQAEPFAWSESTRAHPKRYWNKFPTQPCVCRRDDGISNRVDRIKSLGNAVVPQVVYEIFKAINEVIQPQSQ